MKKLAIICTACLVIITTILVHRTWSEYRYRQEAKAALSSMEAIKPPRFETTVPAAEDSPDDLSDRIIISVNESGEIKLNGEEAGTTGDTDQLRAKLEQVLRERAGHRPDKTVIVRAPLKVRYAEVSKVIDAVKRAGALPVGLQVEDLK